MKLHGYCEKCGRIRRVRVDGNGMARLAMRMIASGVCDECREKEEARLSAAPERRA